MTHVPPNHLDTIRVLYDRGLYLQAYAAAAEYMPFVRVEGVDARILLGRLAGNIGAGRLGYWLMLQAYRQDRRHSVARYFYARTMLHLHGPLAAWRVLERFQDLSDADPGAQAEWFGLRANVAACFRDFACAESWLERALELTPANAWIWIERSDCLEMADRYPEALESAQQSLALQPWFRPGIQSAAQLLQLLGRDEEALALLQEAESHLESTTLVLQAALIQRELGRYAEARESLERCLALAPLADKEFKSWINGLRSDIACLLDDLPASIAFARETESPFYARIAENLEQSKETDRRVYIPVGFVRQHHVTCVPATLTAISRLWNMPAEHLEVAEAICYDGTPSHSERNWAETHGWVTREFTVTWESAIALLDRGVPFTLATVAPGNAHLQAVVGYDARRGTLLVRDPYHRALGEFLSVELLLQQSSVGPRGMALVPEPRAALLEELELPESDLYDREHAVQSALQAHDRERAAREYAALQESAPEHRLTLQARRSLAAYDSNQTELLACADRLLALFPDDPNLRLLRLSCLRDLAHRQERLIYLEEICARKAGDRALGDDLFLSRYAQEIADDSREHARALSLLRRALRMRPTEAGALHTLGRIFWDRRRFAEALTLFRFAACLDDKDENVAWSYFAASRSQGRTAEALQLLTRRFEHLGTRSGLPTRTLFLALDHCDRTSDAFALLETALRKRPEDGDLRLFAAEQHVRRGHVGEAHRLLSLAEGKTGRTAWLQAAARLAAQTGDRQRAIALWREVLDAEPLMMEAHTALARLLAEEGLPEAAVRHFAAAAERFPHHYDLQRLWAEWLHEANDHEAEERVLRRLIELDPSDGLTRRALALALGNLRRFEEAFVESDAAYRLEPAFSYTHSVQGWLCALAGRMDYARAAYQQAIQLSVDNDSAIAGLLDACETPAQRRQALAMIQTELTRQTTLGDGLRAFREQAQDVLSPEELLAALQTMRSTREDLWQAWTVTAEQCLTLKHEAEALDLAARAAERFPAQPAVWQTLAAVHGRLGDRPAQIAALRQALEVQPDFSPAARQLALTYHRDGQDALARQTLTGALARDPLDPANYGALADLLWRTGDREDAVRTLHDALRRSPGWQWAWDRLGEWLHELGRPEEAAEAARDLTRRHPGNPLAWLALAQVLSGPAALPERLAALEHALTLDRRCFDARDLRAMILAEGGRYEEALASCRTPPGVACPPTLKARAAWVLAQQGSLREACAQMRNVLAEEPNYAWGWGHLTGWYETLGLHAECLEAAQRLTQAAPNSAQSFAILGGVLLQKGDREKGKAAFRRALEVTPTSRYSAFALWEACMEDAEHEEASRILERLLQWGPDPDALVRCVNLASVRHDREVAARRFQELCLCPGATEQALRHAVELLQTHSWGSVVEQTLDAASEQPEVHREAVALWAESLVLRNISDAERRVLGCWDRDTVGAYAAGGYVIALSETGRRRQALQFIRKHRERLRADVYSWAKSATALLHAADFSGAVEWTNVWRSYAGLEPWMLFTRSLALRYLNRLSEAAEVSRFALTLPADSASVSHRLLLALDAGCDGDLGNILQLVNGIDSQDLTAFQMFLYHVALALKMALHYNDTQRAIGFAAARREMRQAILCYPEFRSSRLGVRMYNGAVRRIAREAQSLSAQLWSLATYRLPRQSASL